MNDALAPIAARVATFIRLLASDKDGEIIAAVQAIQRTLKAAGTDIHSVAERVEKPNGRGLTEAEMKKLFAAGYVAGVRAAENKHFGTGNFLRVDGLPAWHEIARYCQQHGSRLRGNEQEFVNDMAARTVWHQPTERQGKWLKSIFFKLGGRP
jgi:hypothetical protein